MFGHADGSVNKSAKVVLGRVLINQEARRGAFDVRLSPKSGAKADIQPLRLSADFVAKVVDGPEEQ
jgi:hypothetical protein